jgi:hypothetical protein
MSRVAQPALVLAAGVVLGAGLTLASANLWPWARMAPVLFTQTELVFGVAENGEPALCDERGWAYTPYPGGSGLAYLSERRDDAITALRCRP